MARWEGPGPGIPDPSGKGSILVMKPCCIEIT